MKINTTLALAAVGLLATASPAFAKTSIQGGQNACKAAFTAQSPAPSSFRILTSETRVTNSQLFYLYEVKNADEKSRVTCTVDRDTNTATLTKDAQTASTTAK